MILLDTNVLSELSRPQPSPQVVAWHRQHEPLLALPTIVLAELRFGIARLPHGRRRSSLLRFWTTTRDISDFDVTGISLVNPWDFVLPEPDPGPEA